MTIACVVVDLDGTVVDETLSISPATLASFEALHERGIKCVVATGRMFPSSLNFVHQLKVIEPVIAYQGGMVRGLNGDGTSDNPYPMLYHQPVDIEVAREIIDHIQQAKLHANVYVDDHLFTNELNEKSVYYQSISGVVPEPLDDLQDALTGAPTKIMIIDERCESLVREIRHKYPDRVTACMSRSHFCEIVHHNVSKWNALSFLLDRYGFTPDQVMAIGDQENDLSMITQAGLGIAMGNAPDHVKQQARWVTRSVDDDGLAHAIDTWILNPSDEPSA